MDHSVIPHGSNTVFKFLHSPRIILSYPTVPTPSSSSYTHHGSFRHTPRFQHHLRVPTLTTDHSIINQGYNTIYEFIHSLQIILSNHTVTTPSSPPKKVIVRSQHHSQVPAPQSGPSTTVRSQHHSQVPVPQDSPKLSKLNKESKMSGTIAAIE